MFSVNLYLPNLIKVYDDDTDIRIIYRRYVCLMNRNGEIYRINYLTNDKKRYIYKTVDFHHYSVSKVRYYDKPKKKELYGKIIKVITAYDMREDLS